MSIGHIEARAVAPMTTSEALGSFMAEFGRSLPSVVTMGRQPRELAFIPDAGRAWRAAGFAVNAS